MKWVDEAVLHPESIREDELSISEREDYADDL